MKGVQNLMKSRKAQVTGRIVAAIREHREVVVK